MASTSRAGQHNVQYSTTDATDDASDVAPPMHDDDTGSYARCLTLVQVFVQCLHGASAVGDHNDAFRDAGGAHMTSVPKMWIIWHKACPSLEYT